MVVNVSDKYEKSETYTSTHKNNSIPNVIVESVDSWEERAFPRVAAGARAGTMGIGQTLLKPTLVRALLN